MKFKMSDSFPYNLPVLLGVWTGLSVLAFISALFITEMIISGPGAAQIIGLAFAVALGLIAAALGYAVGMIAAVLCRLYGNQKPVSVKAQLLVRRMLLGFVLLSAVLGCGTTIWQEFRQRPRILYTSGIINKTQQQDAAASGKRDAAFVLTIYKAEKDATVPVTWNGEKVFFTDTLNEVLILNHTNRELIKIDLTGYSYTSRICALPLRLQHGGREDLAVLVELGPASDRSMLLIYNAEAQLIYQELLRRTKRESSMHAIPGTTNTPDLLVVNVDTPVIYGCAANR